MSHSPLAPRHGSAGRPCLVLLSVLGLGLVLVLALALPGCDQADTPDTDAEPETPAYDEEEALDAVDALGQRLTAAMEQQRQISRSLVDEAREVAEQYPDYAPAHRFLAQVLSLYREHEEALEHIQIALELNPEQPEMHNWAGGLAIDLNDPETAQHHYAEAVRQAPQNARYRVHLGLAYLNQQRYDQAREALLQAVQLESDLDRAYYGLSELYGQQGQIEQALEHIERAIELVPDDRRRNEARRTTYVRRRAALLRRNNQPDDALSVLEELPAPKQFEMDIAEEMARCWAMLGEPESAARHFAYAVVLDESNDEAAALAAEWYLRANLPEDAREQLDKLRRINPRHPRISELEESLEKTNEQVSRSGAD